MNLDGLSEGEDFDHFKYIGRDLSVINKSVISSSLNLIMLYILYICN